MPKIRVSVQKALTGPMSEPRRIPSAISAFDSKHKVVNAPGKPPVSQESMRVPQGKNVLLLHNTLEPSAHDIMRHGFTGKQFGKSWFHQDYKGQGSFHEYGHAKVAVTVPRSSITLHRPQWHADTPEISVLNKHLKGLRPRRVL